MLLIRRFPDSSKTNDAGDGFRCDKIFVLSGISETDKHGLTGSACEQIRFQA
jgi:hypothetical protein